MKKLIAFGTVAFGTIEGYSSSVFLFEDEESAIKFFRADNPLLIEKFVLDYTGEPFIDFKIRFYKYDNSIHEISFKTNDSRYSGFDTRLYPYTKITRIHGYLVEKT